MSVRKKIIGPISILICVGLLTTGWISITSLRANKEMLKRYDTVHAEVELLRSALQRIASLESFGERVLSYNSVISRQDIRANLADFSSGVAQDLTALEALGGHDLDVPELRKAIANWIASLSVALAVSPSREIPTSSELKKLALNARVLAEEMNNQALAAAEEFGSASSDRLSSQLALAFVLMAIVLCSACGFVLWRGVWLANAMRRLAVSMERIRGGEYGALPANQDSPDEVGEIARGVAAFSETLQDLSDAKSRIEHMALNDELTGLANRTRLITYLQWLLDPDLNNTPHFAVLHVDLDRFKEVNDTYGHSAGDAVLRMVGGALINVIREDDLAARTGGDEFVIVLNSCADQNSAASVAQRIIDEVSKPFTFDKDRLRVGASVGIAMSRQGIDADRLVANADIALYLAKGAGRGQYCHYTSKTGSEFARRSSLLRDMKQALENGQILAHFQPQVDGITGGVIGVEALARWDHPTRGLLAPGQFLGLAAESGLGDVLAQVIMRDAVSALARLRKARLDVPSVSINLSARQLRGKTIMQSLDSFVSDAGLQPSDVAIEILESVLFGEESDEEFANVLEMQSRGYRIELDDFGTGHASISTLRKVNVDRVKIDRTFVHGVSEDIEQERLMRALVELCKNLEVECLAEGVETLADQSKLISIGCRNFQGFVFAEPMNLQTLEAWLCKRQYSGQVGFAASLSKL